MFSYEDADENDPINGTEILRETVITWRKKSDATVLSTLRAEYKYMSTVPSNVQNAIAQVEQKHLFRANLTRNRNIYVVCRCCLLCCACTGMFIHWISCSVADLLCI